ALLISPLAPQRTLNTGTENAQSVLRAGCEPDGSSVRARLVGARGLRANPAKGNAPGRLAQLGERRPYKRKRPIPQPAPDCRSGLSTQLNSQAWSLQCAPARSGRNQSPTKSRPVDKGPSLPRSAGVSVSRPWGKHSPSRGLQQPPAP